MPTSRDSSQMTHEGIMESSPTVFFDVFATGLSITPWLQGLPETATLIISHPGLQQLCLWRKGVPDTLHLPEKPVFICDGINHRF